MEVYHKTGACSGISEERQRASTKPLEDHQLTSQILDGEHHQQLVRFPEPP